MREKLGGLLIVQVLFCLSISDAAPVISQDELIATNLTAVWRAIRELQVHLIDMESYVRHSTGHGQQRYGGHGGYQGYPNSGYPNSGYPNSRYPNSGYPNSGYHNSGQPGPGYHLREKVMDEVRTMRHEHEVHHDHISHPGHDEHHNEDLLLHLENDHGHTHPRDEGDHQAHDIAVHGSNHDHRHEGHDDYGVHGINNRHEGEHEHGDNDESGSHHGDKGPEYYKRKYGHYKKPDDYHKKKHHKHADHDHEDGEDHDHDNEDHDHEDHDHDDEDHEHDGDADARGHRHSREGDEYHDHKRGHTHINETDSHLGHDHHHSAHDHHDHYEEPHASDLHDRYGLHAGHVMHEHTMRDHNEYFDESADHGDHLHGSHADLYHNAESLDQSELRESLEELLEGHNFYEAVCDIMPNDKGSDIPVNGTVKFYQKKDGSAPTFMQISLDGFDVNYPTALSGGHGFHIHTQSLTENDCASAGPHYILEGTAHGGPQSTERHIGDLGNIFPNKDGKLIDFLLADSFVSLVGNYSISQKSVVIHANPDDFGMNPDIPASLTSGNSGPRIACCTIVPGGKGYRFRIKG